MQIKPGEPGHFDVLVDGALIASKRRPGPDRALFGTGLFPSEDGVVEVIARHLTVRGD